MQHTTTPYDILVDLLTAGVDAKVGATVGYSTPFARGKVSVYTELTCAQTTDAVQNAGEEAIRISRELAMKAMPTVMDDEEEFDRILRQRAAEKPQGEW